MPHYYVNDDLSKARGVDVNLDWLIINHFCEPVNNGKYQVIAVLLLIRQNWQTHDTIH